MIVGAVGVIPFGWLEPADAALLEIVAPSTLALIEILNGSSTQMRPCAASILTAIDLAAKAAVPSLVRDPSFESGRRHRSERFTS